MERVVALSGAGKGREIEARYPTLRMLYPVRVPLPNPRCNAYPLSGSRNCVGPPVSDDPTPACCSCHTSCLVIHTRRKDNVRQWKRCPSVRVPEFPFTS
jgi:hypothetical protein